MANKILADLGLNPLNKFLLVYWFSLGFIVLDQITNISEITTTLAELGSVAAAIDMVAAALILYGAYLLYNKKKQGAIIAIATGIVSGIYWTFLAQTAGSLQPRQQCLLAQTECLCGQSFGPNSATKGRATLKI